MHARTLSVPAVLAVLLLAAGACAPAPPVEEGTTVGGPSAASGPEEMRLVTLRVYEWGYTPSQVDLVAGEPVTLRILNEGAIEHDLLIEGMPTAAEGGDGHEHGVMEAAVHLHALPGEAAEVTFTPTGAGSYTFYCSLPGHKEAGMTGVVRVIEPGSPPAAEAGQAAIVPEEGQPDAGAAPAAEVQIQEISLHPSHMPDSSSYTLYQEGGFSRPVERSGPLTLEVHFQIVEGTAEVVTGTQLEYWTFNGTVPGPMIRARVGDTVDFYLHNPATSRLPHNVDFHAVTGPGGGAVWLDTAPGGTSRIKVRLLNPGIYIYHCAFPDVPTHLAHGMYGLLVVEPEGGLPPVDHEYYLVQSELYTQAGPEQGYAALRDRGLLAFSGQNANREDPTFVVFNGRPESLVGDRAVGVLGGPIQVGETIRLYVGNAGPNLVSSFHVIGEIFDRVYVEGSFGLVNRNVQSTLVPAGGAVAVEMTFDVPGDYIAVDHSLFRIHKGALAIIQVEGGENPDVFQPIQHDEGLRGGGGSH